MKDDVKNWMGKDGQKFLKEIGIKKGQTILDFGCGEGHYAIPAFRVVGKQGKVYALDKNKDELEKLKDEIRQSHIKNIEVINEDSRIPLRDKSVDVALCYDVIHYPDKVGRKTIYGEIYRVLKKKGLFSVYPKHHKEDYPLMELADIGLESIVKEIEKAGFILERKFLKTLLHDDYYNEGYILKFRR